eukprot:4985546-Prymnesium_polylepis.1
MAPDGPKSTLRAAESLRADTASTSGTARVSHAAQLALASLYGVGVDWMVGPPRRLQPPAP